jgi:tRNA-2-methylthio-N6-dimethylallyladenosine synthase
MSHLPLVIEPSLASPIKKVFVKTYGCQMNVYDSDRMRDVLAPAGYSETLTAEDADLVILNTCHIREKAAEKVYSELGRLRDQRQARVKAGKSDVLIAVAGCVAQAEGQELIRREKTVDLVFGPQTYHLLPSLIAKRLATGRPVIETEFPTAEKFTALAGQGLPEVARQPVTRNVSAFLTVQEGCDKFCSFCVVPYTRGAEYSRGTVQIMAEAVAMANRGVKEITLLGQNVNAFRGANSMGEPSSLGALIAELSQIPGIERLRYMTSHPRDMTPDLIAAHAENPKLMPYLHLPVQSGSDRILKAMNRGHGARDYLDRIADIRATRSDMAFTSDFIVGFPGETEADFEATLALIRAVKFASGYSFKYSPRPGTPAAEKANPVPEEVMNERLQRLQALLLAQQTAFNRASLGQTLGVLLEKPGKQAGQLVGRSPYLQPVHVDGPQSLIGTVRAVTIMQIGSNSLSGQFAEPQNLL